MRRIAVAVLLFFVPLLVNAEPRMKLESGDVSVVLHDDPCAMTKVVTNLPFKAVWTEGGKAITGCWGMNGAGIVMFYFDDKTVVGIPRQAFRPLVGA